MRQQDDKHVITRERYDAVLLDLDGVITDTAKLHADCWKEMFDEYLQKRATRSGEAVRPFDLATDYRLYVDGKSRFDGVRAFLASRGMQLPEGTPDDPPEAETVGGLGNRKNELLNTVIEDRGVEPYEGSVRFIHHLRRHGFKIAVVTSSQNCDAVLAAAGLDAFFEPGREILVAESADDVLAALDRSDEDLRPIAARARERVLAEHTADHRAAQLVDVLQSIPAEA